MSKRGQKLQKLGYHLIEVHGVESIFSVPINKFSDVVLHHLIDGNVSKIRCDAGKNYEVDLIDGTTLKNVLYKNGNREYQNKIISKSKSQKVVWDNH